MFNINKAKKSSAHTNPVVGNKTMNISKKANARKVLLNSASRKFKTPLMVMALAFVMVVAGTSRADVDDYVATPPLLSDTTTPMIMLAMPNDHQLYYKAYTDWDDLDGDGTVENTYTHSVDYAGYFDSFKCYTHDGDSFTPVSLTATKYCTGQWSGNFLNWSTMTRMDEIRKVLYGGKRETDTASETVLERAFLPNDAHSFAKYYNGSDLYQLTPFTNASSSQPKINQDASDSGITICNTTDDNNRSGNSATENDPPIMKVVKGNYALWAAGERFQCTYRDDSRIATVGGSGVNGNSPSSLLQAYGNSPWSSEQVYKLEVLVKVCVSEALLGTEDCKQYPDNNYKPVGLLQDFGDDDSVHFGLVSGSYKKNKDGGVLRKNIGTISDEIYVDTNGRFRGSSGIIKTLNTFRIVNYQYSDGIYNDLDDCDWGMNSFSNGDCTNWGNPFAEILMECYRYYAGKTADSDFSANDSTILSGLSTQTWSDPLTADNACSKLNVIAFNASTISYDGNKLDKFSDLNASISAQAATKKVGDGENITGNDYFVGRIGAANNGLCTAKTVNDLGAVEGTCSDAPRLEGTYKVAGIAHHAHVNDIRTDLDGDQLVTTYGVTLSPALPEISLPVPNSDKVVTILPGCHNDSINGNCGLVDFKILKNYTLNGFGTRATGAFYVNWEDSEQGGDYDQDLSGILTYEISATSIQVTTEVVGQSTGDKIGLGYVLGGTVSDGFHAQSGINYYDEFECNTCESSDSAKTRTYNIGTSTAKLLEQPLYYAAKWGGFVDQGDIDPTLGEPIPDLDQEWDVLINATGEYGQDGIPDNYYYAVNPALLKSQLEAAVRDILARTSSGTAASVVTSTGAGEGAVYQALYNPRYDADSAVGNNNRSVTWVGTLHALFLDRYGELREDQVASGEPAGILTDDDPIVTIYYDQALGETMFQRYSVGSDGRRDTVIGSPEPVSQIDPIWSARDQLASLTNLTSNRTSYGALANSGRYIFTGIDDDGTGLIENDEVLPFVESTFDRDTTDYFRLLGLADANTDTDVDNLVNYIRGDETVSGFRNRTIEYDGNTSNGEEPWIFGDIVHSSPTVLSRPSMRYDLTFNDRTYRNFRNSMSDRRQVVFVGANDGMLHAFNSGFYDASSYGYITSKDGKVAHPLGTELWAYVPYNVLPHLKYLTEPNYPHVYYVDGEPQLFDVNDVWASDSAIDHPDDWGTILVVGMRFGGGEITVDPDSDKDGDFSDDLVLKSSYIIMDVTDPESPPEVIAELSAADLGYTVSKPTLVKFRRPSSANGAFDTPDTNEWFLVFGSGPTGSNAASRKYALDHAVSDKTAKVYAYNLRTRALQTFDTNVANAFIGGFTSADWNKDYQDDAVYFGIVSGDEAAPTGKLMRGTLSLSGSSLSISFSNLLGVTNQPFSAPPTVINDRSNNFWVYSGTGRFYTVEDNLSTATQTYYGIKDPDANVATGGNTVSVNDLVETTDINVFEGGAIERSGSSPVALNTGQSAETFSEVQSAVAEQSGWFYDLPNDRERNTTKAALAAESLVFTTYQPTGQQCDAEGTGYLYAPHFQTGLPAPYAPLDTDEDVTNLDGAELVNMGMPLGIGNPSSPTIYQDSDGTNRAIVQTSTGEIVNQQIQGAATKGHRQSWREIPITW